MVAGRAKKTTQTTQSKSLTVCQLKITLRDYNPPIWRRVQVPSDITLGELSFVILAAMGWTNSHLHQFSIGDMEYADPQFELDFAEDEFAVTLADVASTARSRFRYMYDFGDGWDHDVLVEKTLPREPQKQYPTCVKGARRCPPEDCGGVWGYADFLEAVNDPKHEMHEDMTEWCGGAFDPEAFDAEELNASLIEDAKFFASWR